MRNAVAAARGAIGPVVLTAVNIMASPAAAQEYCVACTGPAALYRCVIERAVPSGIPLKLLCIKTLAGEGKHATCAVRSGTVFDCDAPIKRIDAATAASKLRAPTEEVVPEPVKAPAPPPKLGVAPDAPPPPGQPPRRDSEPPKPGNPPRDAGRPGQPSESGAIEQFAKDISRTSKATLAKAGETIKSTAKKSWDCVSTFFKSC